MEAVCYKQVALQFTLRIGHGRRCKGIFIEQQHMERICNANFFRSSPERPGFVERSTFLMDEDDLTCRVHDVSLAEDGLVGAASIMMFITVAYIGTSCRVTNYL